MMLNRSALTEAIVDKAKTLSAAIAGVADIESLKASPSHQIHPKIGLDLDKHWRDAEIGREPEGIAWPPDAVSAVVIGVPHPADSPSLDWWDGKGTPGNRVLIRIIAQLCQWLEHDCSIKTHKPPYLIEKGGIFLKDAAVLAGLGCVGRNNLVITPDYGPRIRFRALLIDQKAAPTGPIQFNPCGGCGEPCRVACPVSAFQRSVYPADALGQSILPGTDGTYDRVTCNLKMDGDIEDAVRAMSGGDGKKRETRLAIEAFEDGGKVKPKGDQGVDYCVKYCRQCELSCPVGRD